MADLSPELVGGHAPSSLAPPPLAPATTTLAEAVAAAEREAIAAALAEHAGNESAAARALGIDRNTLKRKLARYALEPSTRFS